MNLQLEALILLNHLILWDQHKLLLGKFVILAGLNKATEEERCAMAAEELQKNQTQELGNVVNAYMIVGLVSLALGLVILFKKFLKVVNLMMITILNMLLVQPLVVCSKIKIMSCQLLLNSFMLAVKLECGLTRSNLTVNNKENLEKAVAAATAAIEQATIESEASNYMIYGLILFTISRFVCTALPESNRSCKVINNYYYDRRNTYVLLLFGLVVQLVVMH